MSKITQDKNIRGKTQTAKNITINFKAVRISYVKFLCSIRGIKSIYELAKMLKVSYQHLYYVLTGKRQSKKLTREISQILGVDLEKEFQKLERRLKP